MIADGGFRKTSGSSGTGSPRSAAWGPIVATDADHLGWGRGSEQRCIFKRHAPIGLRGTFPGRPFEQNEIIGVATRPARTVRVVDAIEPHWVRILSKSEGSLSLPAESTAVIVYSRTAAGGGSAST